MNYVICATCTHRWDDLGEDPIHEACARTALADAQEDPDTSIEHGQTLAHLEALVHDMELESAGERGRRVSAHLRKAWT